MVDEKRPFVEFALLAATRFPPSAPHGGPFFSFASWFEGPPAVSIIMAWIFTIRSCTIRSMRAWSFTMAIYSFTIRSAWSFTIRRAWNFTIYTACSFSIRRAISARWFIVRTARLGIPGAVAKLVDLHNAPANPPWQRIERLQRFLPLQRTNCANQLYVFGTHKPTLQNPPCKCLLINIAAVVTAS